MHQCVTWETCCTKEDKHIRSQIVLFQIPEILTRLVHSTESREYEEGKQDEPLRAAGLVSQGKVILELDSRDGSTA